MKKIRMGCGSGGCAFDRPEPALDLIRKGHLDYLIFECLSERTMADAQMSKLKDPIKGYNPMLESRIRSILKPALLHKTKIISNMGGANTSGAVNKILEIAQEQGITNLKIAEVTGDDISNVLEQYQDCTLLDNKVKLHELNGVVSGNIYMGGDSIAQALSSNPDIVITGRIADPSLFVGPLKYEFGWNQETKPELGQAILLGHLLECAGQITGGFFADPGYKDVTDLHNLGFPIAEIDESGSFFITKLDGTGGCVTSDVCKEQLLYEIADLANYITPDGIADFSKVTFSDIGNDRVFVSGASINGMPSSFKVNIGYTNCFIGYGEISYGGSNSFARAKLAAHIISKRWELTRRTILEKRVDYLGLNSLFGTEITNSFSSSLPSEIRLRITIRTKTKDEMILALREIQCMYTNGPAGSSGIFTHLEQQFSIDNIYIPIEDVHYRVSFKEV